MNFSDQSPYAGSSGSGEFESTLRMIASLPVPEGLAERVEAGLRAAPRTAEGGARILAWPVALRLENAWVHSSLARSAAAAAIVAVVIGGGWGVYSRVQPAQPARAITVPLHTSAQSGFSSAGAMRTPQTLSGPVVAPSATAHPVTATPLSAKPAAKHVAQVKQTPLNPGKAAAAGKAVAQPVLPSAN
jgi:hypothetical protein